MENILEKIFFKGESIFEEISNKYSYSAIDKDAFACYKKLQALLDADGNKVLEDFIEHRADTEDEFMRIYFKEGLKAGLRLAAECFG